MKGKPVNKFLAVFVAFSLLLPSGTAFARRNDPDTTSATYILILRDDADTTVTVHVGDQVRLRLKSVAYSAALMPAHDQEATTELWRNFVDSDSTVLTPQGDVAYWWEPTDISYKFNDFSRMIYQANAPGTVVLGAQSAERYVCGYAINCPFVSKLLVYSVTVNVLP